MAFESVVTLAAATLDGKAPDRAAQVLKKLGAGGLEIMVLAPGRAVDIFFDGDNPALRSAALAALRDLGPWDVFVQPNDGFRRKKLFFSDMDATVVVGETLDDLAAHLGLADKIAPVTARAMRGEIDFAQALEQRVALLKGAPVTALQKIVQEMRYAPGARAAVAGMKRGGTRCILVSGGFDVFTGCAAAALGFDAHFGNVLEIVEGRLTGRVAPPVLGRDFKKKKLLEEARALNIDPRHVLAVGDGANDIPMLQAAGTGIGYFPKPAVEAAVQFHIRFSDLTSLLYLQGMGEDGRQS